MRSEVTLRPLASVGLWGPVLQRLRVQQKGKIRRVLGLQCGQATCRVLIADDIEDNRQLLAQLLGPVGFEIRLATNGAEAVQEFEAWRPRG